MFPSPIFILFPNHTEISTSSHLSNKPWRISRLCGNQLEENTSLGLLAPNFMGRHPSFRCSKKGHNWYFLHSWLFRFSSTTLWNHHLLLSGVCSSQIPPLFLITCNISFPVSVSTQTKLSRCRDYLTLWSYPAAQPRPLNKMTQRYLFKPGSFCTAPGTDVSVRAFELNSCTPSLWSHLTSHPSNLEAASLPPRSPPPNTFCANPHRRNKGRWRCKPATHVVTLYYLGTPTQMYREITLMEWCILSDLELSLKDKCWGEAEAFNQK